jgi:hypothetical protein
MADLQSAQSILDEAAEHRTERNAKLRNSHDQFLRSRRLGAVDNLRIAMEPTVRSEVVSNSPYDEAVELTDDEPDEEADAGEPTEALQRAGIFRDSALDANPILMELMSAQPEEHSASVADFIEGCSDELSAAQRLRSITEEASLAPPTPQAPTPQTLAADDAESAAAAQEAAIRAAFAAAKAAADASVAAIEAAEEEAAAAKQLAKVEAVAEEAPTEAGGASADASPARPEATLASFLQA